MRKPEIVLGIVGAMFLAVGATAVTGGRGVSRQGSYLQSGTGAVLQTIEDGFRARGANVKEFGAIGDGVADDRGPIAAAIAAVGAGGTVFFPCGTYAQGGSGAAISRNVELIGAGRDCTTVQSSIGTTTFAASGTITKLRIADMTIQGAGGASKALDLTGVTSSEGWFTFERIRFTSFGGPVITTGTSTYIVTIRENTFINNSAGSIVTGQQSDTLIDHNFFENSAGTAPVITVNGPDVHITRNYFIRGGPGTITGPDILLTPATGDQQVGGYTWISQNKFGLEGESSTRVKIQCQNATAINACGPVYITDNTIMGVAAGGQTAIRLTNPIFGWVVDRNVFVNISTVIDDIQSVAGVSGGRSVFGPNNTAINTSFAASAPTTLFTNGGRQFSEIYPPHGSAEYPSLPWPRNNEPPQVQNRLLWSEDLSNAAWTKTGTSITTGQTDPYGGTRAQLVTRANAAGFERVSQGIGMASTQSRFYVKFWAKAGTLSNVTALLFDNTVGGVVGDEHSIALSSAWKQYMFSAAGFTPGNNISINFYPGGVAQLAGTITLFGVSVADYDVDYYPTTAATVLDTTTGNRWERKILAQQGIGANGGTGAVYGVDATGGSTSGNGVRGTGGTPNGYGVLGVGTGAGGGGSFTGGATGVGLVSNGGATSGNGGTFTGGGASSSGVFGTGGSPNGWGVQGTGTGAAGGGTFAGGATGVGVSATGNGGAVGGSFTGGISIAAILFANINAGATGNGTILFCSDCTIANPCAGGGTGAIAKRLNGVWVCN